MSNTGHNPALPEPEFDWAALLVVAAIGSALSIIATGFVVGVRNDIYYLPIIDALYDESQFANDSFIQSLRYFSSGPWMLLSDAAKHFNTYWLLLGLQFLSRFIAFIGLLACATLLGVKRWPEFALLTALLCTTSLLRGQSLAGDGGLFINYFTHSEIANGLTLIVLYLLIRGRLATALVANGLVFFINAFIGVWDAAMITAVTMAMAIKREIGWRNILLKGSVGTALAAVLVAPVVRNVLTNPEFGKALKFDYLTYLEEFWPYHFIFSDIAAYEKLGLGSMVALGIVAFVALGKPSRLFLVAFAAFSSVYAVGIAVPHLTHSPLILNLHLLRVSTMLQLLVVLGSLTLATRWWFCENPTFSYFFSPVLILLLCTPIKMTTIQPALNSTAALLVIAASFYLGARAQIPKWLLSERLRLNYIALGLAATGFCVIVSNNIISNARAEAWIGEWATIGDWAKSYTSPNDLFLVPTWTFRGKLQPGGDENEAILNSGAFESTAHRAVWVDFRNGAAVLWLPSYYEEWHERVTEVTSLTSVAARDAYAKAHGIQYIVDVCGRDGTPSPVFSTKRLCVYATER